MGKRGSQKRTPNPRGGSHASMTLREESIGKKKQTHVNAKSMLKLDHLKNLAIWAAGESSIGSLGALFGRRLAACGESLGIQPDPSLFSCQRCETILQPGHNCTVRIEKNRAKLKRGRKKSTNPTQNNVVYNCHFCSHQNLKRGTPRGHMKQIHPPKVKPSSKLQLPNPKTQKCVGSENNVITSTIEVKKIDEGPSQAIAIDDGITSSLPIAVDGITSSLAIAIDDGITSSPAKANDDGITSSPALGIDDGIASSPATPLVRTFSSLLDVKKRKRNKAGTKKSAESASNSATIDTEKTVSASSKRKRKSWTSLKEIAESSARESTRKFPHLTVPFLI